MTKYSDILKPQWDTIGWFSTLLVRLSYSNDPVEQNSIMMELATISDEVPTLRPYAREAGVPHVLPDNFPQQYHV